MPLHNTAEGDQQNGERSSRGYTRPSQSRSAIRVGDYSSGHPSPETLPGSNPK